MKLHLPGKLRAALLACYAISASLVTTVSSGSFIGGAFVATAAAIAASQQATAATTILYTGGVIENFNYGTVISDPEIGDISFNKGDNITFTGDTSLALAGNVEGGIFSIAENTVLDLSSNGYRLDAAFELRDGVLRLSNEALAETAEVYRSNTGRVELAWESTSANLVKQLANFSGVLDINGAAYEISGEENNYALVTLHGEDATLMTQEATYTRPLISVGDTTIDTGEFSSVHVGAVTGFGSITKLGEGTWTLKANHAYHYGDITVKEGILRWGVEMDDANEAPAAVNKLSFANIIVEEGGIFVDSHMGRDMGTTTSITLKNGTVRALATGIVGPTPSIEDVTANTYKALYVQGTGDLTTDNASGRRFHLLSSLNSDSHAEGDAPDATTLTINHGTQYTYTIFDRIENYAGDIVVPTSRNNLDYAFYINEIHQDADYDLTITTNNIPTSAFGIVKTGEGSATIAGAVRAEDEIAVKEGMLAIQGKVTAEQIHVSGGVLETQTNPALDASEAIVGTVKVSGGQYVIGDRTLEYAVDDLLEVTGGELLVSNEVTTVNARRDVKIKGGTVTVNGILTAGNVEISADADTTFIVKGAMTTKSLSKRGAAEFYFSDETEAANLLSVTDNLTMNYGGTEASFNGGDFSKLSIKDGIVLSYYSTADGSAPNVIKIPYQKGAGERDVEYLFADVFDVTAADLYKGINLGIESDRSGSAASRVNHLYASTLGVKGVDYIIEERNGYYYLKTLNPDTVATTNWDINWGTVEVSSAPETVRQWSTGSIDNTSLWEDLYHEADGYFIAAEIVGTSEKGSSVYGGAYASAPMDPEGDDIQRDIWLKATGGDFILIAGGSMCAPTANAGWSLSGDTHIFVGSEVNSVGTVVGGNFLDGFAPTWVGDGFITIDTDKLTGSVAGGGYCAVAHEGDSTVYVYKALKTNTQTEVLDYTMGDTEDGVFEPINSNTIAAGMIATSAQWVGDGKVVIDLKNDKTTNRMTKSIVGGSFTPNSASIGTGDTDLLQHVGNNRVVLTNLCEGNERLFTNYIVGGDVLINAGSTAMEGDTYVEFSHLGTYTVIGSKTYSEDNVFVTAGHMGLNISPLAGPYTTQNSYLLNGNTHLSVTDAENAVFNVMMVAGHAVSRDVTWDGATVILADREYERQWVGTINGDTYVDIDSGTYRGMIVGGHYYEDFIHDSAPSNPGQVPPHPAQGTELDTLTVTGTSHITLTGGTYRNTILGASYYDGWDNVNMMHGAVEISAANSELIGTNNDYGYAVVGGYYIDEYFHEEDMDQPYQAPPPHAPFISATVGDIHLTFANNTTDGIILGGSHILRAQSAGAVRQGEITLDLLSGTFNGNIYAAGCQMSAVELFTESTTVRIADAVEFGEDVTVSGGYMGSGTSSVHGDATLEFVSASKYENLGETNFIFFDVIKVTEKEGHVVLPHNATLLGDYVTQRGAGTVELSVHNDLDMYTVAEGTLKLAANSGNNSEGTKIIQLNLCKGATLDMSAGNCGINGTLVVEGGSSIIASAGNAPTALERLIWDDSELVMLTLNSVPNTAESYVVELFSGISKADIIGIDMRDLEELGYGVRASQYISSNVDLTNTYLLLQGDTLVLSRAPRRSIYWEYEGGGSGYWIAEDAWSKTDEGTPNTVFNNEPGSDNVVFSNYGADNGAVAVISVGEEVMPYDIYVQNGNYQFTGTSKEAVITPYGSIVLSDGATAVFDDLVKLNTSAETTLIAVQDEASYLEVNNDISIYQLQNQGRVRVVGNLAMTNGTNAGGVLEVTEDLTVGGSSSFSELIVDGAVKGNADYTLAVDGKSSIGSIDGGVVAVAKGGELIINPEGDSETTTLKALQGAGSLNTQNDLVLTDASKIGNLDVQSLDLGSTLDVSGNILVKDDMAVADSVNVTGTLSSGSITYKNLILKSNYAMIDVEGNVYSSSDSGQIQMNVDTSLIATKILSNGQEYYLLKCDEGGLDGQVVFDVKEGEDPTIKYTSNDRYDYSVYSVSDGVVLKADLTFPDLFENYVAETPNGMAGGKLLDELYINSSILEKYPNGDLALTMEAINQQLLVNNSKAGLDELFAAVAGSSIPSMGMAFTDDINRQLKAVRNRTTTMGVDQSAVNEDMPYFNAWINAEGGSQRLDQDSTASGYELNNWGGTVGFDVDFSPRMTAGLAISAMYGDYTAESPDRAEGDMDTQYVTAFARYGYRSWIHTFVASYGRMDATLERTVSHAYGNYTTKGETEGSGFGLMYEVGYVAALNESGSACIQPVVNFTLAKSTIDGYTEENSDAALTVGDIEMTSFTVGAGARIQAVIGESLYNRASIFECRALAKFYAGDRQGEAEVGFAAADMGRADVVSAEMGAVGIELGAGVVVPLGAQHHSIFADVSAEINSGYTGINGTVGYRINF